MKALLRAICVVSVVFVTGAISTPLPEAECIVPAKAGGGFELTCKLAQVMLADDRALRLSYLPGGIGALAYTALVTRRTSDPTAIVAFSAGSLLNVAQGRFGPYSEADVRWLAVIGADYGVIAVRRDSPFHSLKDVARALKADVRSVAFGAGGTIGSQDWVKAALLSRAAGVSHKSMRFVAFEGGGDALAALEGGHVDVVTGDFAEVSQHVAGRQAVRLLAVLAEQRLPGPLAGIPTAKEQGFDIVWATARGFYVGAGVTDAAYREWSELLHKAMTSRAFPEQRAKFGLFPMSLTGESLHRFIKDSMSHYRKLTAELEIPRR